MGAINTKELKKLIQQLVVDKDEHHYLYYLVGLFKRDRGNNFLKKAIEEQKEHIINQAVDYDELITDLITIYNEQTTTA